VDNKTGRLLLGIETEFGFTARDAAGNVRDTQLAVESLLKVCGNAHEHLRGSDSPVRRYLANGGLLYPDVGHPEYATAECSSPLGVLQSLRAGEKMLSDAACRLEAMGGFSSALLYRTNVDYSAIGTTWGCHESYLSRRPPAEYAATVVPHLVSRIVYTRAGGFDNRCRGAEFVLSPRVFYLSRAVEYDSCGRRAIFSLRDDPLSGNGFFRNHLICGESNCADLSTFLKCGTTALVLALAEAGVEFGASARWVDAATDAMRRFSRDPGCREQAAHAGGPPESAIDLQYRYLQAAEKNLDAPFMPPWAEQVCAHWREVLDKLADDPQSLVGSLDWPTKLALFKAYVRDHSELDWDALPVWTTVTRNVCKVVATPEEPWPRLSSRRIEMLYRGSGPVVREIRAAARLLDEHGLGWAGLDAFQDLRDRLCELDIRYGQLHPKGLFLELAESGTADEGMVTAAEIAAAAERAPEPGRARIRGDWIRRLAAERAQYRARWTGIQGETRVLDLGDPLGEEPEWEELP